MGLDMYARVTYSDIPAVDFEEPSDGVELHYWRKHPDLHGWMEKLYREKGGQHRDFNVVPVRLDLRDLDRLEHDMVARTLPHTEGFFFGASHEDEQEEDLKFIKDAREAMERGARVYYTSWWYWEGESRVGSFSLKDRPLITSSSPLERSTNRSQEASEVKNGATSEFPDEKSVV